jgi:hypothetical protein
MYNIRMNKPSYKRALADAQKELRNLFRKREEMERQIARLRQTIVAIGRVCEPDATADAKTRNGHSTGKGGGGLTDAVRTTLMSSRKPLDAIQLRDMLDATGYDPGSSAHALIAIHTALRRLLQAGEVKTVGIEEKNGPHKGRFSRISYWWGEWGIPKPWSACASRAIHRKREKARQRTAARKK